MSIPRLVCCLLIFASSNLSLAAEGPLIWKFQVGDEHSYRMTQNMDMEMSLGATGRKIETRMQQVLDMTWKIEQVDDQGQATLVQTIRRVQMELHAPGQKTLLYDTDSDEAPTGFAAMLVPLYKAMTAEPSKLTLTPRGEIKDFEMPKALGKAIKAIPGAAAMGDFFGNEGFRNVLQQSALVLPEPNDLKPGHQQTTQSEIRNSQFGVLKTEATYRYLGPREVEEKRLEVFSIALKIDFEEAPDGMQMDITSQESHGEILFNREAGRLESSKIQQNIHMNISAAGQEMTQTMAQTMTFQRIEK